MKRKLLSTIICVFLASCTQTSQVTTIPITPTTTPDKPVASATPQATSTALPTDEIPTTTPKPFEPKYTFELVNEIGRGMIKNMAVSPDGKVLVVASSTGVWMYRMSDGKLLQSQAGDATISIPYSEVADIVWSPDGKYLAVTQDKNGIWIWDGFTWELLTEIVGKDSDGKSSGIPGFAWSSDGKQLALGKGNGEVWIWSSESNSWEIKENKIDNHNLQIGMLWKEDDQLLTLMGFNLYDVATGEKDSQVPHGIDGIGRVIWSPTQTHLYYLFDLGGALMDFKKRTHVFGGLNNFSWSLDGKYLAAYTDWGQTKMIYIANTTINEVTEEIETNGVVDAIAWTPDNELIASIYQNGNTSLINLESGKTLLDFYQHNTYILAEANSLPLVLTKYSPQSGWDIRTHEQINISSQTIIQTDDTIKPSIDSEVTNDGFLNIYIDGNQQPDYTLNFDPVLLAESTGTQNQYFRKRVIKLAVVPDKNILLTGNASGDIMLWNIISGELLGYQVAHCEWITKLFWDNENMLLYSNSTDGTVKVWEIIPTEN